jgi:predicted PolB exonuclease-like 3'-5' exonuclease
MIKLFFDIETLPSADEDREVHLEILRKKNKGKSDEEIHLGTSFEGTFGRICCIAIIKEGPEGVIQQETFSGDEKEMLEKFWEAGKGVDRFVGHNIWEFDLPFIYKRSIINGVRPIRLNLARYRDLPIYDTMLQWEMWNMQKKQKLDTLAKIFNLPTSKDEMDGSMVYDYFKQGRLDDICRYCMKDVVLTRSVYYKMAYDDIASSEDLPF